MGTKQDRWALESLESELGMSTAVIWVQNVNDNDNFVMDQRLAA